MQAAVVLPSPESNESQNAGNEPQEQADQVNPDCILHPFNARVHLCVLVNVQRPEKAKDCAPQDEEDHVPGEENRYSPV